jgi:hypothetical protein
MFTHCTIRARSRCIAANGERTCYSCTLSMIKAQVRIRAVLWSHLRDRYRSIEHENSGAKAHREPP